jgi:hypothetical protein
MLRWAMAKTSKRPRTARPQGSGSSEAEAHLSSHVSHYDRERVAARAYELYMQRGGAGGSDVDDWLAAEREFSNGDPSSPHEQE